MYHYVYEIRAGKQFYIGCRTSKCLPEHDIKYKGSGVWCLCTIAYTPRIKTVLSVWKTREEAETEETRLIRDAIKNRMCMNRRVSSPRKRKCGV